MLSNSEMSRRYSAPSVDELLESTSIDENVNIDEGLASPNDERDFLVASMAFLRRHLKRKLDEIERRPYTDTLLFEVSTGDYYRKMYVPLKDGEKFDEIRRSEVSIPSSVLSSEQILPVARKQKLRLPSIFRSGESPSMRSIFNVFRKSGGQKSSKEFRAISPRPSVSSESSFAAEWRRQVKIRQREQSSYVLSILPSLNNLSIRSKESRVTLSSTTDVESVTTCTVKRIKKQQSKLSVCLEDESESDGESFARRLGSTISYNNFPDDLKEKVSRDVFHTIINQMIVRLEDSPGGGEG